MAKRRIRPADYFDALSAGGCWATSFLAPVCSFHSRADVSKLPAYVGTPLADNYLLLRINKVIEAEPKKDSKEASERAGALMASAQYDAYVASLRKQADIEINQANLERK